MPRPKTSRIPFQGPWRGVSKVASRRSIPLGEFSDARNVVNRFGRVGPRPGYEVVRSFPFLSSLSKVSAYYTPTNAHAATWDPGMGTIYCLRHDNTISKTVLSTGVTTTVTCTGTTPWDSYGICYLSSTSKLIFCNTGDNKVVSVPIAGGASTVLFTLTDSPIGITTDGTYFYAACGSHGIYKGKVDGSGVVTEVIDSRTNLICMSPDNNYLVFAGSDSGGYDPGIYRVSPDGSGLTELVDFPGYSWDEIGAIHCATVDSRSIVWWSRIDTPQSVYRSLYDGTGSTVEITDLSSDFATGILVNYTTNTLYLIIDGLGFRKTVALGDKTRIISSCPWQRVSQGVAEGEFSDDLVLLQILDEIGKKVYWAAWFALTDEIVQLQPGKDSVTVQGHSMTTYVITDRDNPSSLPGDSFQNSYGRADYAYMGGGLNTGRGGIMVTNGGGAYVFNFVLGNSKQTITITDGGTVDTFTLTFNGQTTGNLDWDISLDDLDSAFGAFTGVDQVRVTGTPGSSYVVEFRGSFYTGRAAPALTGLGTGCTVTIDASTQVGGTEEGASIIFRPAGLPTPVLKTSSYYSGVGYPTLFGTFSWRVEFYSSQWGIHSPSMIVNQYFPINFDSEVIVWDVPNNVYFNEGFIDRVKIYRKRWGSYAGGTNCDGIAADDAWYYLCDWPCGSYPGGYFHDHIADEGRLSIRAGSHGYPPNTAQFVEVFQNRVWIVDLQPGGQTLAFSQLPDNITGELGMELFLPSSSRMIENTKATDHPATGLKVFDQNLILFTNSRTFVVNPASVASGLLIARRLPGGNGCASKWCIVETDSKSEFGGRLVFPDSDGQLYTYDGASQSKIGDTVRSLSAMTVRQTWAKVDYVPPGLQTWYYASAVFDQTNRRIIIATFGKFAAGGEVQPIQYVFDIDAQSWFLWDIRAWNFFSTADIWQGGDGSPAILFSDEYANIMQLVEDRDDSGTAFDWFFETGRLSLLDPIIKKLIRDLWFNFDTNGDTTVSIVITPDDTPGKAVTNAAMSVKSSEPSGTRVDLRCADFSFKISGSASGSSGLPTPCIVSFATDAEIIGA